MPLTAVDTQSEGELYSSIIDIDRSVASSAGSGISIGGGIIITASHVVYNNAGDVNVNHNHMTSAEGLVGAADIDDAGITAADVYDLSDFDDIEGFTDISFITTDDMALPSNAMLIFDNPLDAYGDITAYGFPSASDSYSPDTANAETMHVSTGTLSPHSFDETIYVTSWEHQYAGWITERGFAAVGGNSGSGVFLDYSNNGQTHTGVIGVISTSTSNVDASSDRAGISSLSAVYDELGANLDALGYNADDFATNILFASDDGEMIGTFFNEDIYGTNNADTLSGADGDDRLMGEDGNDMLFGGAGTDTLMGGAGDDSLFADTTPDGEMDYLFGGAGQDTAFFADDFNSFRNNTTMQTNGGLVTWTFTSDTTSAQLTDIEYVTFEDATYDLTNAADIEQILQDNSDIAVEPEFCDLSITNLSLDKSQIIKGEVAKLTFVVNNTGTMDALDTRQGIWISEDTIIGNADDKYLENNPLANVRAGTQDSESSTIGRLADLDAGTYYLYVKADYKGVVDEADESNNLSAPIQIEILSTDASNSLFTTSDDTVTLTEASDVSAQTGHDVVYGSQFEDGIKGGGGNDLIYGNSGDDIIKGNTGDDMLYGNDGNDVLQGADGQDVLIAGAGTDILYGGADADVFVFNYGDTKFNKVFDFEQGEDLIDLTAFGISFDDLKLLNWKSSTGSRIRITDEEEVRITGVTIDELTADDFLF